MEWDIFLWFSNTVDRWYVFQGKNNKILGLLQFVIASVTASQKELETNTQKKEVHRKFTNISKSVCLSPLLANGEWYFRSGESQSPSFLSFFAYLLVLHSLHLRWQFEYFTRRGTLPYHTGIRLDFLSINFEVRDFLPFWRFFAATRPRFLKFLGSRVFEV